MAGSKRALLSCYDKTGLVELAGALREYDYELICTRGTLQTLTDARIDAISVADFTGVPEMFDGRVKSLHPKVHAGLLGIRDNKLHVEQMQAHQFRWIDFIAVNLHPLEELAAKPGVTVEEVIEQIDIGGTAMVRSGAKNFRYVTVVVNPARYRTVIHEMRAHDGDVPFALRRRLANEAFERTAGYDRFVADYLHKTEGGEE